MEGNGMTGEMIFQKRDEIVPRSIVGETILVPIRGKLADMQRIFSLNPVAEFIWGEIDGQKDIKEISNDVLERFDIDRKRAASDIGEFMNELLKADLISVIK